MSRIAVYGKGGIGKSTISANLSVSLARQGLRVVQIGCDPKHDSTRLLMHGAPQRTVLDYIRDMSPVDYRLSDVLGRGYLGIGCVEAGGPQPGVGCAGRGIISTFELLNRFKFDSDCDAVIYDVLGDVVCGGFAVPIRREYADTILIVTSGEFMALYAANNILRGIETFDGDRCRIAGIVQNCRDVEGEDERVRRFAAAVGLPIFAKIPRSDAFTRAEHERMTVMEMLADGEGAGSGHEDARLLELFDSMARRLAEGCELHAPHPLSDSDLEAVVLGGGAPRASSGETVEHPSSNLAMDHSILPKSTASGYLSKNVIYREPLHGCAFNGAMTTAVHLTDAVLVAHAPKSCAYISIQNITSSGRRTLFERGTLLPRSLLPSVECTEMGQPEMVFGGWEKLESTVKRIKGEGPKAIVAISACPAGIIGDDTGKIAELSEDGLPVIAVQTDGNMTGDFQQGVFAASIAIARALIDRERPKAPKSVDIIGEKAVVTNSQSNYELIAGYLERMGIDIACRFLYDTTIEDVRNFATASLVLPAYTDFTAQTIMSFFRDEYGMEVFDRAFPIGFDETCEWLRQIGGRFDAREVAEEIIAQSADAYAEAVEELRPSLTGKRLMVFTYNCELDWLLKTALDCGMEIVKICLVDYSQDMGFRTRLDVDLPVEMGYDPSKRAADIEELKPDVVLANYTAPNSSSTYVSDVIPMCPDVGFGSGLALAQRWARRLDTARRGLWEQDEQIYRDRYSR
ncbi:MAG: AAA family ATPase [bacterium]|nr:AAA family ATPase [bacterium]